jgi:DNA-binding LytR/AlgR family response regulator
VSENVRDFIELELNQFICVQSEGNYVLVYYYNNQVVKKQFIRNSLTAVEDQVTGFEVIKRCHRSYIVNFQNVIRISGNARNYSLHIAKLDFSIPVSRSFPKMTLGNLTR